MMDIISFDTATIQNWRLKSTIRALHTYFPEIFGNNLPLQRGIHEVILATIPGLGREALEEALDFHTKTTEYLENVVKVNSCRYNLKGNVVSEITDKDKDYARKILKIKTQ